jgi:ubiquinone/menaquinone biosynthesis C-methylase UbiE
MSEDLDSLYRARFDSDDLAKKARIWRVLCQDYFQRYIGAGDTVLDLACGTGEFINNIRAAQRIGVDLRTEAKGALQADIRFVKSSATDLDAIEDASVDVVFTSNFLEHLRSKDEMMAVLTEVRRLLRPGGRFLIMGPNIRYVAGAYWDFFDHHLPLTERSVAEALSMTGFEIDSLTARFLPYSTKSRLPQAPWLVSLYLKVPLAWRFLGQQFIVVARRHG